MHHWQHQNVRFFARLFSFLAYRKKVRYNRVLPLSEYLTDRWQKAQQCGFGGNSSCYDSVYIFGDVKVGDNTFIGPFCILDGSGGLAIGSYCSISAGVQIYTHNSVKWAISQGRESYDYAPVVIEDGCYIGPNTIIAQGVRIGTGAVVGACSFVNHNVAAHAKVAGVPARTIGETTQTANNKFGGGGHHTLVPPSPARLWLGRGS
ncbi:MAG: acyltransferase [Helicobacter sp.]|nr:acyltransferase [Helicobacter sp.]